MSLVALILANETLEDQPAQLRAETAIGGVSLLERQAERALDAGARHILILVTSLPQPIMAAIDRIGAGGAKAIPVRTIAEILPHLSEGDRLLIIGDGLHADTDHYRSVASASSPALLVTSDSPSARHFERIDTGTRWAGLALLPRTVIAELATIPSDWDAGSTLLRQAIQSGAQRILIDPALFECGDIALISDVPTAQAVEAHMLQNVRFSAAGMGQGLIYAPLVRLLGPASLRRGVATLGLLAMGCVLMASAVGLFVMGETFAGALSGIVASLLAGLGRYQMMFRRAGGAGTYLSEATNWLSLALPFGLVGPAAYHSGFDKPMTVITLAAVIALAGLWLGARWLPRLRGNNQPHPADSLLPDAEIFLVITAVATIFTALPLSVPIALVAAIAGILIWLRILLARLVPSEKS